LCNWQGAKELLSAELADVFQAGSQDMRDDDYFPKHMPSRLRRRQVAAAHALYREQGITREDRMGCGQQFERNFRFFRRPGGTLGSP
jgi:hypothetical protein